MVQGPLFRYLPYKLVICSGRFFLVPILVAFWIIAYLVESELGLLACLALGRNVVLSDGRSGSSGCET